MEIHPDIIAGLNGATMHKLIFSLIFLVSSKSWLVSTFPLGPAWHPVVCVAGQPFPNPSTTLSPSHSGEIGPWVFQAQLIFFIREPPQVCGKLNFELYSFAVQQLEHLPE